MKGIWSFWKWYFLLLEIFNVTMFLSEILKYDELKKNTNLSEE